MACPLNVIDLLYSDDDVMMMIILIRCLFVLRMVEVLHNASE